MVYWIGGVLIVNVGNITKWPGHALHQTADYYSVQMGRSWGSAWSGIWNFSHSMVFGVVFDEAVNDGHSVGGMKKNPFWSTNTSSMCLYVIWCAHHRSGRPKSCSVFAWSGIVLCVLVCLSIRYLSVALRVCVFAPCRNVNRGTLCEFLQSTGNNFI